MDLNAPEKGFDISLLQFGLSLIPDLLILECDLLMNFITIEIASGILYCDTAPHWFLIDS